MPFNSIDFAIFLPLVFVLYWGVFRNHLRAQNGFLLSASYVFYGAWDWRFLGLIILSSAVDYILARLLMRTALQSTRRWLVGMSLAVNLGLLGYFKYAGFFIESFANVFTWMGRPVSSSSLSIILPVGISFYTFQTLSYTIDVYRKRIAASRDILEFFTFVAFFPQLVAGPIERAWHFLPQFSKTREFDPGKAVDGLRQILWGLFKKVVVADQCAVWANEIFGSPDQYGGSVLLLGAVFFAIQIYGDFSGYTDIAIGTARLFGFSLMQNFAFPYFSRDIAEFWRRWHISLTSWFKDYLYIPLGGSKYGLNRTIRNVALVFLVSGFWHGANWTFIVWGALHALYYLPVLISGQHRRHLDPVSQGAHVPGLTEMIRIGLTFFQVCIAWVFFRAASLTDAFAYLKKMVLEFHIHPGAPLLYIRRPECWFILILFVVEWMQRTEAHGLDLSRRRIPVVIRWAAYILLANLILYFHAPSQDFIYFQF